MSENLVLKSISEILEYDFFIPSYQRGYRWGEQQVKELLDDILEFANDDTMKGFYCLQPIVVKKESVVIDDESKERYRVIDGQQRLTTLYIILKYLEELLLEEHGIENIYRLSYETRNSSLNFLKDINQTRAVNNKNIDFYYMSSAFLTIKNWFLDIIKKKKSTKRKFLEILMGADKKDIKFIWYETKEKDEIGVFTRLNVGKIPLTNAELIKALFVLNIKEENEKIKLTTEWDNIEYTLQNSKFFAFLNDAEYKKATKIEFIFDVIADEEKDAITLDNLRADDDKYSFYIFNTLINSKEEAEKREENVKKLWKKVKKYFRIFNELYNSNTYYHLVGYLVNNNSKNKVSIKEIIRVFENNNKDDFEVELQKLIRKTLPTNETLSDLNYNDDKKDIYNILFLFNVISTLNSEYTKYPFDRHKSEQWSLEHIHAQNSQDIKEDKQKIALLESELKYIQDDKKREEIQSLLEEYDRDAKNANKSFEAIQELIFSDEKFGDGKSIKLHTINNLALLSGKDNSSLNNSIFPAKRDKIIELDKKGSFIPIGTKNLFLKYYSHNVDEAVQWNQSDMDAYLVAIKEVLKDYLGEK